MSKKFILFAIGIIFSVIGIIGFTRATVSADGYNENCGPSAVVKCGVYNQDMASAAPADAKALYTKLGISSNLSGTKYGVVHPDGKVVVDGKTVATSAMTFGRVKATSGDQLVVAGDKNFWKHTITQAAILRPVDAFVFMTADGQFKGAIIKMCGNPVVATPVPKPEPPKVQTVKCVDLNIVKDVTLRKVTATVKGAVEYTTISGYKTTWGDGSSATTNPATHTYKDYGEYKIVGYVTAMVNGIPKTVSDPVNCVETVKFEKPVEEMLEVCDLETKNIVTIKKDEFDAKKHTEDLSKCNIEVCELDSKEIISIKKEEFDDSKHSMDLADCKPKIHVCDLNSGDMVWIDERIFDDTKYSKDPTDCDEPAPEPEPEVLPDTGPAAALGIFSGVSALGAFGHRLWMSRRSQF